MVPVKVVGANLEHEESRIGDQKREYKMTKSKLSAYPVASWNVHLAATWPGLSLFLHAGLHAATSASTKIRH